MHFKFIEAHFPKSHPWASLIGACASHLSRPGSSASIPDICRPTFKKAGACCQHQLLSSCLERMVASWPNFLSPVSSNAARCQSLGTASRCSARTSHVSSNPAGIRDHPAKRHWLGHDGKKAAQLRDGGMVEVEDSGDNSRDHAWSLRGDSAWHQVPHKAPRCKNVNPRQIQPPSLCVQPALACVVSSGVDVTE